MRGDGGSLRSGGALDALQHDSLEGESWAERVLEDVLRQGKELGYAVTWGDGKNRGALRLVRTEMSSPSILSVLSDGVLWINLCWLRGSEELEALRARMSSVLSNQVGLTPKGSETDC